MGNLGCNITVGEVIRHIYYGIGNNVGKRLTTMVSSREEQEELVKSLMVSPAIRIGKAEMAIGVHNGAASIMIKDTESGIHYSLTFPSQDLEVFPNVNLSLQCVLRFVRTAAQVGILVGEIASGEKAERENKFGPNEGKVDPDE